MTVTAPSRSRWPRLRQRLRELLYELRVEGDSPARQSCAVALGVFIGCTPLYGLHLPLCIVLARLFGLNRLKTYLAAHVSTPIIMPFLLFSEIQVGRLLRGAPLLTIHVSQLHENLQFWHWRRGVSDLLVGSLVIGLALAIVLGSLTFWLLHRSQRAPAVEGLIERTAHRYIEGGLVHTELVRGKLRHDPVYLTLLERDALPCEGEILDLGCGRSIPFALLLAAAETQARGEYPEGWPAPPDPDRLRLRGLEPRAAIAAVAQRALGASAQISAGDLRAIPDGPFEAVLLIDVLHYISRQEQEEILSAIAHRLALRGRLLLREADASRGWRFARVRLGERLSSLLRGRWRQRFHYRSLEEWRAALAAVGLSQTTELESCPSGNTIVVAERAFTVNPQPAWPDDEPVGVGAPASLLAR